MEGAYCGTLPASRTVVGSHTVTDSLFTAIILSSSDQFVVDDKIG